MYDYGVSPYHIACLLPVNQQGEVLLMLRDDKPGLPYPNHWSMIGRRVEDGESVREALLREVEEETGLKLTEYFDFRTYESDKMHSHIFYGRLDLATDALTLGEGQEQRFFAPSQVGSLNLVPSLLQILPEFFASPEYVDVKA